MNIQRKRIIRGVVIVVVVAALMLTMHLLVNNLDILSFLRSIHGG